jgi:PAS domain S-box
MHTSLSQWLQALESQVLERCTSALVPVGMSVAEEQQLSSQEHYLSHNLPVVYAGLIAASEHNLSALTQQLHQLERGFDHSTTLTNTIQLCFRMRRIIRDLIAEQSFGLNEALALFDQLDDASEILITRLTQESIAQADFLAESLAMATEEADKAALQLSALNEVSQQLSASLDVAQLLKLVGEKLIELIGTSHISIWLNEQDDKLRCAQVCGNEDLVNCIIDLTSEEFAQDLVARTYRTGLMSYEIEPNPSEQSNWYQQGCSIAILPLLVKEQTTGVVILQDHNPDLLTRQQVNLARAIVNQAAIALENARLYEQIRRFNAELEVVVERRTRELQAERDRLSILNEIANEVSSTLDLDQLLHNSLEALARLTNAQHGSVMLLEQDTGHLVTRAVLGEQIDVGFTRFPSGRGIAGWVAQHKRPALVPDVRLDERWVSLPSGQASRRRKGALIAVPLIAQHEIMGVITLSHPEPGIFNEDHLRLLIAAAGEIAVGVHNAHLYSDIVSEMERRADLVQRLRRESGQNLAILQSLADGVLVCDLEGNVLSVNPAAANILQRNTEELLLSNMHTLLEELAGKRIRELPLKDLLQHPINSNEAPRTFQATIPLGQRTVSVTLSPVLMETKELIGALALFHDISREIEADRLKTEFIGTMSHELRTPMTSIKGFTQLLALGSLGPVNETQRESLNTISYNAERMISIINDVLDITKIETNSVELDLRSLHLADTISSVVTDLQSSIQSRNHTLGIKVPPDLPLVIADSRRLQQILHNLLQNAIKYTPRGGKIDIAAHVEPYESLTGDLRDRLVSGRTYVQIDISDNGVGIAPEDQTRIFERFYRTNNPLRVEAGGTGLGLSLVRPLVELLGGYIWFTSELNKGSTFSFVLPADS